MQESIRGWPILLVLYYAKKIPLHIKLQKMLFLIFSEAKIKLPYDFKKFEHGPYDPEIKIDFMNLGREDYINVTHYVKPEKDYYIFKITKKGEEYVENTILKTFSTKDSKRIEKLVLKYKKMDWRDLVTIVYENYNLQKNQLESQKEITKNELPRIRPIWSDKYDKNDCEYNFTTLALIDYINIMLNKRRFDELDITQYNVLMHFLREMMGYLKTETASFSSCPDSAACDPIKCEKLSEVKEMFLFVQYLGEKFKILPSTFCEEAYLEDFDFEEA